MFDNAFFGITYFGESYFGQAGDTPVAPASPVSYLSLASAGRVIDLKVTA